MRHAARDRRLWALALIGMFGRVCVVASRATDTARTRERRARYAPVWRSVRIQVMLPRMYRTASRSSRSNPNGLDSTTLAARSRRFGRSAWASIRRIIKPFRAPAPTTDPLVAWRYFGPGATTALRGNPYRAKRTNRTAPSRVATDGFAGFAQSMAALDLRGKSVRLRGLVRVGASDNPGGGALWLRVDRGGNGVGCFDNMMNRLVREATWREYVIQCDVAADATSIVLA